MIRKVTDLNNTERLQALSSFLKEKRNAISPEQLGISTGGRRRVKGLRREEVALLAGLSISWYTRFEQGKDITLSLDAINAIARVLHLNQDEKNYLLSLAYRYQLAEEDVPISRKKPNEAIHQIISAMPNFPILVTDRHLQIVDWNELATKVFLDFNQLAGKDRNLIKILFTREEIRRLAINWEEFVNEFMALFRAYYGRFSGDTWYSTFINEMTTTSPRFTAFWNAMQVANDPEIILLFRHSKVGKLNFKLTSLQTTSLLNEYRINIFIPETNSIEKVVRLQ